MRRQMLALSALSVLAALGGPLRAASLVHGTYPYAVSSVPLLAELTKLAVCGVYLLLTKRDRTLNSQHLHLYILPSLLYLCVNNLNFVSLENLNVHTAQMLSNLRIPFTAVLMKWLLKSQFSALQIRSVIMLTLALGLHQVPYVIHAPDAGARHQIIGVVASCLAALASAFASVHSEWALKKRGMGLAWQGVQLHSWGVMMNAAYHASVTRRVSHKRAGLIEGYSVIVWINVVHLAIVGLVISWVLKKNDSISKACAVAASLMLAWTFDVLVYKSDIDGLQIASMCFAIYSIYLYHSSTGDAQALRRASPLLCD